MENLDSVQDLIFILVYKLGYSEEEVLRMERWVAKKRLNQFEKYQKEKQKHMKDEMAKNKAPSSKR